MHILINIISRMINEMITEDKPCEIDDVKFWQYIISEMFLASLKLDRG